jgi:MYXO-CTERM domain-containing protein
MELACDGIQLLQIPMPKTRQITRSGGGGQTTTENLTHYYLELRTPRGIDTGMNMTTVLVHVSGKLLGRKDRAVHTWILDMDQGTSRIQGMTAGKTFMDPAGGVSFTVMEIDANHATINVEMDQMGGGPTCMDGAAFTAPGPSFESCNPTPTTMGNGGADGTGPGGAGGSMGTGTGGRAGPGGTPGTGGSSTGTGGRAGTGGTPGSGGRNSGGGGAVGTGGTGTGGNTTVTTGGTNGSSGGAPGSGGTTIPGSGGAPPTPDAGPPSITPGDVTGGCACATAGGSPVAGTALAFGAVLLLGSVRRRRRR